MTGTQSLSLSFLVQRVLPAKSTVLLELELAFHALLILTRKMRHFFAGAALHFL